MNKMEALKSYLFTAMLASLASSLFIRISDPRHRGYLRYVAGLALLLLLAAPLTSLAEELSAGLADSNLPAETENITDGKQEFIGEMGRTMSRQIGDLVADRFHLPREAISVKLTLDLIDLSAISIYHVNVTVSDVECDVEAIDLYLTDSLCCEVTVTSVQTPDR